MQTGSSAGGFRLGALDTIRGSFSTCPLLPSTASRSIASTGLPAMRIYGVSWAFARRAGGKKCAKIRNFCRAISGYR
jgi:hypothetical protein